MQIGNHAISVLRTASQSQFSAERTVTLELNLISPVARVAAPGSRAGDTNRIASICLHLTTSANPLLYIIFHTCQIEWFSATIMLSSSTFDVIRTRDEDEILNIGPSNARYSVRRLASRRVGPSATRWPERSRRRETWGTLRRS